MAELEHEHWWYRGRRAVIRRLLERLELPLDATLLEVGSGSGGNLPLLSEFGDAFGLEPSSHADHPPELRRKVVCGRAPYLPIGDESVDVVAALDVLEHLHDELAALVDCRRVLRRGGWVVLYVPAYQLLWGHEDIISAHLRRYRAGEIRRLLVAAGFEVFHLSYSNMALFPIIAAAKVAKRLLLSDGGPPRSDVSMPPPLLNDLLSIVTEAEAEVAATMSLPFGASVLAAARKLE